ncbi:MAG: hypothetical protein HKL87_04775, partial [Acidimicrobiaceae bacterium]|nr:hypothetical protein [Acidimicrobiaceae bacterium]
MHFRRILRPLLATSAVVAVLPSIASLSAHAASTPLPTSACGWVAAANQGRVSAARAAAHVAADMTTAQLANYAVIVEQGAIINTTVGDPALCLPALTLTDGPVGVASRNTGVTQFPSEMAVAATFDPLIARSVGFAMGQEALKKGFDVLQGPDLNLVRTPNTGRAYETYGEDPWLAATMGVFDIRGIQSTGVMANAKHYSAYTQENARGPLNQSIGVRVLTEIYNYPFRAAVQQAHVASIMCAMGSINGVNTCSSPGLYAQLRQWGFTGFVRSDYQAVVNPVAAYRAGINLVKPLNPAAIVSAVAHHQLSLATLRGAVSGTISAMIRFGLLRHLRTPNLAAVTITQSHVRVALRAATESIVLLKNTDHLLPLSTSTRQSVAVIGIDAKRSVTTAGKGSSAVIAPWVVTPLAGLQRALPRDHFIYVTGQPTAVEVDSFSSAQRSIVTKGTLPPAIIPIQNIGEPGTGDLRIDYSPRVTQVALTATRPGAGEGWSSWTVNFTPRRSGIFEIGLQDLGDTWLTLNGAPLFSDRGLHGLAAWSSAVHLVKGQNYTLHARWFAVDAKSTPSLGILNVQSYIAAAVQAAKHARVAVVFAANYLSEGVDQSTLALPADQNALIEAVAKVNPRTVVVMNTGGAVLTPWRSHVAGIVEAWYPGQVDGTAIADVLSGRIDPAGRLPVSFPTSPTLTPTAGPAQFPGVNGTVQFGSLSDIGYRWYQSHGVSPAYPFGFGLSYTHFSWSNPRLRRTTAGERVSVRVTNTGRVAGSDVVEVYLGYPSGYAEPPMQLRGAGRVTLAPGRSKIVNVTLPFSTFSVVAVT